MVGRTLSHYEILAPLGAGGMGEVYRARDTKLERDVAIKLLPEELAADSDHLARFEREAKLLAALNHPNIATIHNLEEHDGKLFLVLELIEGESLAARLIDGPLPSGEALEVSRQIAQALEAAHEAGIIHRDLKPANVLVSSRGPVKIVDFGIARNIAPAEAAELTSKPTDLTVAGTLLGTVPYMSPEQLRGEDISELTDIWALGCVIYEMLTGRGPFTRKTTSETLAAILKEDPYPLADDVPAGFADIVSRCLAKSPERRVQSTRDVLADLERLQTEAGSRSAEAPRYASGSAPSGAKAARFPGSSLLTASAVVVAIACAYLFYSFDPWGYGEDGPTRSDEALGWYRRAESLLVDLDPGNVLRAINLLDLAIEEDPDFAEAWVLKGRAHEAYGQVVGLEPREHYKPVRIAADTALAIDGELGAAHDLRGLAHVSDYQWELARASFERAIVADPTPMAYLHSAQLLNQVGEHERALEQALLAVELDRENEFIVANVSVRYTMLGLYPQAVEVAEEAIRKNEDAFLGYFVKGWALSQSEDYEGAIVALETAKHLEGGRLFALPYLGFAYARADRSDDARQVLAELHEEDVGRYIPPSFYALVHIGLGEPDRAYEVLEGREDEGDWLLPYLLVTIQDQAFRQDDRFRGLLQATNLADYPGF